MNGIGDEAWIAVDVGDLDVQDFEFGDGIIVVFTRTIYRYGERPWIIGAYLDPDESKPGQPSPVCRQASSQPRSSLY